MALNPFCNKTLQLLTMIPFCTHYYTFTHRTFQRDIFSYLHGRFSKCLNENRGGSRISSRGGAQNYVSAHTSQARSPLIRSGSRGRLRALETLRFLNAFSCYLSLVLKHSDTKWDTIKHIVNQNLGGHACTCCVLLYIHHWRKERFSAGLHCQHIIRFLLGLSQYKTKENVYKKFVTHEKLA